jgi:hypothetical protein
MGRDVFRGSSRGNKFPDGTPLTALNGSAETIHQVGARLMAAPFPKFIDYWTVRSA